MVSRSFIWFVLLPALALCFSSCADLNGDRESGDDTPHAIVYNANGSLSGTVPVDSNSYKPGTIVTVLGNTGGLVKAGYTFKGWTLYANGNGDVLPAGGAFAMGRRNLTLYAKWALPPGSAVWAQVPQQDPLNSYQSKFNAAASDSSGNAYAAGTQNGTAYFSYGPGVSVKGIYSGGNCSVLVKYDAAGKALWAAVPLSGNSFSGFFAAAADSSGNVYAAGFQQGTGDFVYGPGVTVTGSSSSANAVLVKYDPSGKPLWVRVPVGFGDDRSYFYALSADSSGNVYAAGYQYGTGEFTYNPGNVKVSGGYSNENAVLVKYDASGNALWARVSNGNNYSRFNSVAAARSGSVYAAGYQYGNGEFTYNPGNVKVSGGSSGGNNAVLVKYDASGNALWANVSSGSASSAFKSVAADSSGNVYAAGYQYGNGIFDYGGVTTSGGYASGNSTVLVKYGASGNALWAAIASGGNSSAFNSVAADTSGNAYASGSQLGTGSFSYGNGITAAGVYSVSNAVLVKYDSSGNSLWAATPSSAANDTEFFAVASSVNGVVLAAGTQNKDTEVKYGIEASAAGTYSGGANAALVQYLK